MSTETESKDRTQGWSTIDTDVLGRVARVLREDNYWRCMAPRLRMVSKHWRRAVDAHGLHLSMRKLPDYPLCRSLQKICQENTVTSLASFPQYGRLLLLASLWDQNLLPKLQSLSVFCADNADVVLHGIQIWRSSLRRLELMKCIVKQSGLDALTHLVNVTDLQLHYVDHHEKMTYELGFLGKMTQLRRLSIANYSVHRCFDFVSLLTGLETLEIISRATSIDGLSAIEYCTGLKKLRLSTKDDSTSVDFVSRMTQLTALALSDNNAIRIVYPPGTIQSLGLLCAPSQKLEEEFRRVLPARHSADDLKGSVGYADYLFTKERLATDMPISESLTSLNVVCHSLSEWTFQQLTAFRHLQQLRMHLGEEPFFFKHNGDNILLPWVTLWTIDMDWVYAGLFASRSMPSLKELGILIKERFLTRTCFEYLASLPGLERIHIARGESCGRVTFWSSMRDAFDKLPALRHLGWKPLLPKVFAIPEESMDFFAERNIAVDDDCSIFIGD